MAQLNSGDYWQAFFMLVGLGLITFISGYVPQCISSKKLLNLLAVFGGGILMGAALLVVLPESVGLLISLKYTELMEANKNGEPISDE